jgi:calreticulin
LFVHFLCFFIFFEKISPPHLLNNNMRLSIVAAVVCVALCVSAVSATVFYKETFDNSGALDSWVTSNWKKSDGTSGEWEVATGPFYGDAEADKGLRTTTDARFYAISTKFDEAVSNRDKDLVFQFQVRHPQKMDCGGGYIKLMPADFDQTDFSGESPYLIMFGPDICGTSTRKVHTIFGYGGKNLLVKKDIQCETDELSHVYTLIIKPDETYEVRVDGEKRDGGKLEQDWDFTVPKEIADPDAKKPADWVDSPKMDDPEDVKPEDWDNTPKQIPDPAAEKPDDWDDEVDGDWEPPMIANPEYKGEWKARQIDNPDYKGPWKAPLIANPDYKEASDMGVYDNIGGIGIELWQVKAGTVFDNIIVTDDVAEAESLMADTFSQFAEKEKEMFQAAQTQKREEEEAQRKKIEEERQKQDEAAEDDDEDEDDEDEDEDEDDDLADKIKDKLQHDEL